MKKLTVIALFAAAVASGSAAQAQSAGSLALEVYAGYYIPGLDELDNDTTLGARVSGRPADQWGWSLQVGFFDLNGDGNRPLAGHVGDASGYFVDGDLIWYPGGGNFGLFGGLGFATVDVDVIGTTEDVSDDAFTYNLGAHYVWNFGDKFLVKPEVRMRKFEGDTYEKWDQEYTVSFGWRLR